MSYIPILALDDIGQWLESIETHDRAKLTVVAIIGLVAITGIICALIRSMYRLKTEANLKRELIDQGKTPDEIERIISARTGRK